MPQDFIDDQKLSEALDKAQTIDEVDQITLLRQSHNRALLADAIKDFTEGTIVYLDLMDNLRGAIRTIGFAPGLEFLLNEANRIHIELNATGMRKAGDASDTDAIVADPDAPIRKWPKVTPITSQPTTSDSRNYADLKDEYVKYFVGMQPRTERMGNITQIAAKALQFKPRYATVGRELSIPWWFIAGVHALESTFNFNTHLHNGDPLTSKTTHVPRGRPKSGSPPFAWEDSAIDALGDHQKLANLSDWSLPRALWRWERYNGFGYRRRQIPTPYLWSFSTVYEKGKFTSDSRFSANAVSKQCGAAVLLKHLHEKGAVELDVDRTAKASGDSETEPVIDRTAELGRFGEWWRENLSHIDHFGPHELLVKGGSHATNGLNTDPPERLWPNAIALVNLLETIRKSFGRRTRLNSVYRSKAYNTAIRGAKHSQHMDFTAADIVVDGVSTAEVAKLARRLRSEGVFKGGIGKYRSFTHVDVRGHNANW